MSGVLAASVVPDQRLREADITVLISAVPKEQLSIDYNELLGAGSDEVKVYKGRYGEINVAIKVMPFLLEADDPPPELTMHM